MTTKRIVSKAPTRLDLAGGTLDIWPLYTFLKKPATVNVGIDLFAEAEVRIENGGKITLESGDQGKKISFGWDELHSISAPPALDLHLKLLRYFHETARSSVRAANHSLTLSTVAKSPAGAGIGGSSSLAVAIIGALASWSREHDLEPDKEGELFVEVARDIETTVIQVPAGVQDYYGAMFGGLQSIRWKAGSHDRIKFQDKIREELEKRIVLFYSGQSRNSGINNWALFKSFIDDPSSVRPRFQALANAAQKLEEALNAHNWDAAGQAIAEEWETRRTLAKGITTDAIDRAFAIGRELGATAGKVCGAGGGGCFFLYVPSGDEATKERIREKICGSQECNCRALPFKTVKDGLDVRVSRA